MPELLVMVLGMGFTAVSLIGGYMIRSLDGLRKRIDDLCERVSREETKSGIYHKD